MRKKKELIFLLILIAIFIAMNYTSLDSFVTKNISPEETIIIERVIDGDTVVYKNGNISQSVRLLGINTPERGEKYYAEAKNYTESLVMNKTIKIERRGKDLYYRDLAYLFYNDENLNSKIIEKGYANAYFPEGKDVYFIKFSNSWEECIESNKNLCEKSLDECADCIEISEWNFESQKVVFYNDCNIDCNLNKWTIKDEGRKKYVFNNFTLKKDNYVKIIVEDGTNTNNELYWKNQTYVWTSTGDTIFLRDAEGKLVLWESGNY